MDAYWTTIFTTTYAPSYFNSLLYEPEENLGSFKTILGHENIHIQDFKKYHIWMILTYLFPPIFSYGRFYWERKAYLPELMDIADTNQYSTFYARLNFICDALSDSSYCWCWFRPLIKKWFLKQTYMSEE